MPLICLIYDVERLLMARPAIYAFSRRNRSLNLARLLHEGDVH